MRRQYANVNILWADIFVDELARCGVRHAVISPGSRSTPLVMAFALHPDIADHSIIDERSAAFYALGLAKGADVPVALVCTSGTAAANYYPAICEANLSGVPLIILTADRPAHLRDSGAPQTMDQTHLYGRRVRWFHEIAQPEADELKLRYLRSTACHGFATATGVNPGPVHINFPFRKPLEPVIRPDCAGIISSESFPADSPGFYGRSDGRAYTLRYSPGFSPDASAFERISDQIRACSRILILAGPDPTGMKYREALQRFVNATGIPVFAEAASQQRYNPVNVESILATSDLLLRSPTFRNFATPDLILRVGAAPTNTIMQEFLEQRADEAQILISSSGDRLDPDHCISRHIQTDPANFLSALAEEFSARPLQNFDREWSQTLIEANRVAVEALDAELRALGGFFEGHAHHSFVEVIPEDAALVVSSSLPIRDLETFLPATKSGVEVYFNRGVNGIDGMTSTAMGVARARGGKTVLLTGDIAFLHDLNGLAAAKDKRINLTIVILNNNGGRIFELLPIREFEPVFSKHFVTPQQADLASAGKIYGLKYSVANSLEEFIRLVSEAMSEQGVQIIEARVDADSATFRRTILKNIAAKIDAFIAVKLDERESRVSARTRFALARHRLKSGGVSEVPVILLHGFTRNNASWLDLSKATSDSRAIYAIDLMGHGLSPIPEYSEYPDAYTLEYAAGQIIELLHRISFPRFHLVGYSMGGRCALHFATMYPRALASLAIISATAGIEDETERHTRYSADFQLAEEIERSGLEDFVDRWIAGPMFEGQERFNPKAARKAREERMLQTARGLANSLRGMGQGNQRPLWDELPHIHTPTLIIAGGNDQTYCEIAKRMEGLIPNATMKIIPNTHHDIPLEAHEALARELTLFWRQTE